MESQCLLCATHPSTMIRRKWSIALLHFLSHFTSRFNSFDETKAEKGSFASHVAADFYDRFDCRMSRETPVGGDFRAVILIAHRVIDIDDVLIKSDARRALYERWLINGWLSARLDQRPRNIFINIFSIMFNRIPEPVGSNQAAICGSWENKSMFALSHELLHFAGNYFGISFVFHGV